MTAASIINICVCIWVCLCLIVCISIWSLEEDISWTQRLSSLKSADGFDVNLNSFPSFSLTTLTEEQMTQHALRLHILTDISQSNSGTGMCLGWPLQLGLISVFNMLETACTALVIWLQHMNTVWLLPFSGITLINHMTRFHCLSVGIW